MKQRLIMWLAVVAGVVLVLAVAWAAILWTRPEPIRIAFANSLSGPSAPAGTESLVATQLAIDEVNAKGGVNGRPIELVLFDDASNPAVARANAQAIADSPCVAVLGHYLSSASLAAAPAYKDARIPALTGSAAADDLTSANEYYFRALAPISAQARSIAEHLRAVMKEPKVRLVHTRDSYGKSFERGFAAAYPVEQLRVFGLDVAAGQIGSMDEALDAAAQEPGPGVIVVGAAADFSRRHRQGAAPPRHQGDDHRIPGRGPRKLFAEFRQRARGKSASGFLQRESVCRIVADFRQRRRGGAGLCRRLQSESGNLAKLGCRRRV